MSKSIQLLCGILISVVTSLAHAGFHFEPYLGTAVQGEWKSGSAKDDISMNEFGLKLGYQAPSGFQIGGDIQMGTAKYKGFGTSEMKAGQAAFGLYLGYQSASGFRGYVDYLFASALAFDDVADTAFSGSGAKLGVGYSILRWLAINVEYHMMTYDKFKTSANSSFTDLSPENKNNLIFLNLSFPFNFGG